MKFGVARYLYQLPRMSAKPEQRDGAYYLPRLEEDRLRAQLTRALRQNGQLPAGQSSTAEERPDTEKGEVEFKIGEERELPVQSARHIGPQVSSVSDTPGSTSHWIAEEATRKAFYGKVSALVLPGGRRIDQELIHQILQVDHVREFPGTAEEATRKVIAFVNAAHREVAKVNTPRADV